MPLPLPFGRQALLALASLLAAACSPRSEAPAPPAASPPPAVAAAAPVPACQSLQAFHAGSQQRLEITTDGNDEVYTVQFELRDGQQQLGPVGLNLPVDTPESIAVDTEQFPEFTTVCAGHVFVLNLAAERGGTLVIGNHWDDGLTLTHYRYLSGDEDTAQLDWRDGALLVTTSTDGTRRLLANARSDAVVPHGFLPEALVCEVEDDGGAQWLSLGVDIDGGVREVEYLSTMPGGTHCNLSAARNDGETEWQDEGAVTRIAFEAEADTPSLLRIGREGPRYRFDASELLTHPLFCGQSAQMARSLALRRGEPRCSDVQWPQ